MIEKTHMLQFPSNEKVGNIHLGGYENVNGI